MSKYQYNLDGDDYKFSIESSWSDDSPEYIAEECAKDFYENHDGWESKWPLTFYLFNDGESNSFAKVEIEMEFEPTFYGNVL